MGDQRISGSNNLESRVLVPGVLLGGFRICGFRDEGIKGLRFEGLAFSFEGLGFKGFGVLGLLQFWGVLRVCREYTHAADSICSHCKYSKASPPASL